MVDRWPQMITAFVIIHLLAMEVSGTTVSWSQTLGKADDKTSTIKSPSVLATHSVGFTLSHALTATTYTRNPSPTPTTYTRDIPITETGEHTLTLGHTATLYTLSITSYTRIASATPTFDDTFTKTVTHSARPTPSKTQLRSMTLTGTISKKPTHSRTHPLTLSPPATHTPTITHTIEHIPTRTHTTTFTGFPTASVTTTNTISQTDTHSRSRSLTPSIHTETKSKFFSPSKTVAQCKRVLCSQIMLNDDFLSPHAPSEAVAWQVSGGTYYINEAEGEEQDAATENGISHHYHYCHIALPFTRWSAGGEALGMKPLKRLLLDLVVPCGAGTFIRGSIDAPLFGIQSTFPFEYSSTASPSENLGNQNISANMHCGARETTLSWVDVAFARGTRLVNGSASNSDFPANYGKPSASILPGLTYSTPTFAPEAGVPLSSSFRLFNIPSAVTYPYVINITMTYVCPTNNKQNIVVMLLELRGPANVVPVLESSVPGALTRVFTKSMFEPTINAARQEILVPNATNDVSNVSLVQCKLNSAERRVFAPSATFVNTINAIFSNSGFPIDLTMLPTLSSGIPNALVPYMALAEAISAWLLWSTNILFLRLPLTVAQLGSAFALLRVSQCALATSSLGTSAFGKGSVEVCGETFDSGIARAVGTPSDTNTSDVFSSAEVPWLWGYTEVGTSVSATSCNLPPLSVGYLPGPDGTHLSFPWLMHPLRFPLATPTEYSEWAEALDAVRTLQELVNHLDAQPTPSQATALLNNRISVAAAEVGKAVADHFEHLYLRGTILWCLFLFPILIGITVRVILAPTLFWLMRLEHKAREVLLIWQRREIRKQKRHRHHRREHHSGKSRTLRPKPDTSIKLTGERLLYEPEPEEQSYLSQGSPRPWHALAHLGWPWVLLVPIIATAHGASVAVVRLLVTLTESDAFSGTPSTTLMSWRDVIHQPGANRAFSECLSMLNAPTKDAFRSTLVSTMLYGDSFTLSADDPAVASLMKQLPVATTNILYQMLSTSDDTFAASRSRRAWALDRAMAICGSIVLFGTLVTLVYGIVSAASRNTTRSLRPMSDPPVLEKGLAALPYSIRDIWESVQRYWGRKSSATPPIVDEPSLAPEVVEHPTKKPRLPPQLLMDLAHCDITTLEQVFKTKSLPTPDSIKVELPGHCGPDNSPRTILGPRRMHLSRLERLLTSSLTSYRPCMDRIVFDQMAALEANQSQDRAKIVTSTSESTQQPSPPFGPTTITDEQLGNILRETTRKAWDILLAIPKCDPIYCGHRWRWSALFILVLSMALAIVENIPTSTVNGCSYKLIFSLISVVFLFVPSVTVNTCLPLVSSVVNGLLLATIAVSAFLYGSPNLIGSTRPSDFFGSETFFSVMLIATLLMCVLAIVPAALIAYFCVRTYVCRYLRASRIIVMLSEGQCQNDDQEMRRIEKPVRKTIANDSKNELRRREHEASFSLPKALAIPLLEVDSAVSKRRSRLPLSFRKPKQKSLAQMISPETFSSSDSEADLVGLEDIDLDDYHVNLRLLRNDEKSAAQHFNLPMNRDGFILKGLEDIYDHDNMALDLGLPKGPRRSHVTPRTMLLNNRSHDDDSDKSYNSYTSSSYTSSSGPSDEGIANTGNEDLAVLDEIDSLAVPDDVDALEYLLAVPYPLLRAKRKKIVPVVVEPPQVSNIDVDAEEIELKTVGDEIDRVQSLPKPVPTRPKSIAKPDDAKVTRKQLAKEISAWKASFLEANGRKPRKSELMAHPKMSIVYKNWMALEEEGDEGCEKDTPHLMAQEILDSPTSSPKEPKMKAKTGTAEYVEKKRKVPDYAKGLPTEPTERLEALKRRLGQRKRAIVGNDPKLGNLSLKELADQNEEIAALMAMYTEVKSQVGQL